MLLSTCSIMTALIPSLENHLTQRFFGDLATVLNLEAQIGFGFSSLAMLVLLLRWRKITEESFALTVLHLKTARWNGFFVLEVLSISFSVMIFGLLFTLGALFLGTGFAKLSGVKGIAPHTLYAVGLSVLGIGLGFLLSLSVPHLPTAPTLLCVMVFFGTCSRLLRRRDQSASFGV